MRLNYVSVSVSGPGFYAGGAYSRGGYGYFPPPYAPPYGYGYGGYQPCNSVGFFGNYHSGYGHQQYNDVDQAEYAKLGSFVDASNGNKDIHVSAFHNLPHVNSPQAEAALGDALLATGAHKGRMKMFEDVWHSACHVPAEQRDAFITSRMEGLTQSWGAASQQHTTLRDLYNKVTGATSQPDSKDALATLNDLNYKSLTITKDGTTVDLTSASDPNKHVTVTVNDEARKELGELGSNEISEGNAVLHHTPDGSASITFTDEGRKQLQETVTREYKEGKIKVEINGSSIDPSAQTQGATTQLPPPAPLAQASTMLTDGKPNDEQSITLISNFLRNQGVNVDEIDSKNTNNAINDKASHNIQAAIEQFSRDKNADALKTATIHALDDDHGPAAPTASNRQHNHNLSASKTSLA